MARLRRFSHPAGSPTRPDSARRLRVTWDIDPTFIGPWPLPWHALFAVFELAIVAWLVWYWRKNGKVTPNELSWLLIAGAAHVFYTLKLADDHPTFELEIRYYGIFFAVGLLLAARAMPLYFERWGFPRKHGEALTLWTPIGMILGAHFVHLIFYEPDSFLNNPIRILQIGSGLASHGGGLGAILAVIFFARRYEIRGAKNILAYMDPAMCAATFVIPWVRVGNLFNSEIVGRPWDGPWAVRFLRHMEDCRDVPAGALCEHPLRHPSQVYEAILGFIMVGIAVYLQRKWRNRLRPGAILFILLAYYFTTRFGIEYLKELQAATDTYTLTMGQKLSIPIVLFSLYMLIFSKTSNIRSTIQPAPVSTGGLPDASPALAAAVTDDAESADAKPAAARKKRKKKKA